jgi:hypothetical protein
MMDQPLDWLKEQPAGLALLSEYARQEAACPPRTRPAEPAAVEAPESVDPCDEEESSASWIPRLMRVEGIESASMPALHGRLIALGLLKFEFFAKSGGMKYRLSTQGRQFVSERPVAVVADETGPTVQSECLPLDQQAA